MRPFPAFILAFLVPAFLAPAAARAQDAPPQAPTAREQLPLHVIARGTPVGIEQVVVERSADGWLVTSSSRLDPLTFVLRAAEFRYSDDWRARSLTMQGSLKNDAFDVRVTIGPPAKVMVTQGTASTTKTDEVSADTVVLPNLAFAAYVALARRLVTMEPGTAFRVYVAPQAEVDATLENVSTERLRTVARTFEVRRHRVSIKNPGGAVAIDVVTEPDGRLARVSIPAASLEAVREDVAAVSTRQEKFSREGDEDVSIPGNGFNLAGTISRPRGIVDSNPKKPTRLPAVVLVAGSGQVDRDEVVAGIPIFGQLAAALADAGFLVVRYDKRGVGQSGGRAESATLDDYAEDLRAVVTYLDRRKDVDDRRIHVVGHSEGAWVALLAASRDKRIASIVMAAGPSVAGADLVLEQQKHVLDQMGVAPHEAEAKIALQKRINSAVMSGTSWEGVEAGIRRQADTPWFASFLRFNPTSVMPKVRQPILVVQGELDRQVPAHHAERLAEMARARKKGGDVAVKVIPGVNHLFVPAKTGEVGEYASLEAREIDVAWATTIVQWLRALPTR